MRSIRIPLCGNTKLWPTSNHNPHASYYHRYAFPVPFVFVCANSHYSIAIELCFGAERMQCQEPQGVCAHLCNGIHECLLPHSDERECGKLTYIITPRKYIGDFLDCVDTEGMSNTLLIPDVNVKRRAVKRRRDIGPNAFVIMKNQWPEKPRLDIQVQNDSAPVFVKRIAVNSFDGLTEKFKMKYKVHADDTEWKDFKDLATGQNKVCFV